ncbi:uncharacterized protein [Solanum tuberosum]|uniref:uncharacterized protein isoform X2 n=1 Tax=Solanum tuberosum TaxID=4113 RepID=UPI00073A46B1|nr:PREDICTED: uncharacterized protein LOC102585379 isoform X2 [Solanum tuberosum]
MMENQSLCDDNMEEAEYILLDLDDLPCEIYIPPNAPYVLSIGQYDETIGTCLVFYESDTPPVVHEEAGPSEANLCPGRRTLDPKQTKSKQVKPVTQLQNILKFRLLENNETEDAREKPKED